MRFLTVVFALFVSCAVFAQTYRSGGVRRANFGAQAAAQSEDGEETKSSVPGAKSNIKTRTFTSYGARQRAWRKGVQTHTVQTSTAGTADPAAAEDLSIDGAEKTLKAAVKSAPKAQAPASGEQAPAAAAPTAGAPAMPAEAAAAMQQLQGLQDMMKSLPGAASSGTASMPAMPNMAGMPDLSALMGGAAGGKPAGK